MGGEVGVGDACAPSGGELDGAAAAPPPMSACTTLCLWEPDASLMIRKAKGQERARKSEYAAEARKGATAEAASESGVSVEIRAFEEMFAVELRAVRDTMEQVMAQPERNAETPKLFDWWHEQLRELHHLVSGASSYLPTQLREKFVRSIAEHEAKLRDERERLTPRKKFGFKNRTKVGKAGGGGVVGAPTAQGAAAGAIPPSGAADAADAAAAAPAAVPTGGGVSAAAKEDTFQAPAGCDGFHDQRGTTLVRPAGLSMAGDFALQDLTDCDVRLLSSSSVLWIRGLSGCTVFGLPVKGSIYVTQCKDCTFYLGSRQLRIHTSQRVDFYVHASSHPILEHCSALRFAPYPPLPAALGGEAPFAAVGIAPEHNQWHLVDDFDWLKASHSPNWTELPEADRKRPPLDDGA